MTNFRTLDDLDVTGKRVLLRADFNVPMKDGKVSDLTRIERGAASIRELSQRGAKVVVLSHFGRPNGKPVPEMSLKPIAAAFRLSDFNRFSFTLASYSAIDCVTYSWPYLSIR